MANSQEDIICSLRDSLREFYYYLKTSHSSDVLSTEGRDIKVAADIYLHENLSQVLKTVVNVPVLSEEQISSFDSFRNKQRYWILDPLDGSENFSRGIPLYCISIALVEDGEPVLGLIYDLNQNCLYSGGTMSPAKMNETLIKCSDVISSRQGILCTGIPLKNQLENQNIEDFKNLFKTYKKVRMLGSAALSLAYVASGKVEAYQESRIRIWDVAAGVAIVRAAGGSVSLIEDDDFTILDVFASNGKLEIQ